MQLALQDALEIFGLRRIAGRPVRVAVVDSGIRADHPHVQGVARGISLVAGANPEDFSDQAGHGTITAAAIREKAPGVELVAVKIFDRELVATVGALAEAIEWASAQGVDLINLSLGSTNTAHAERLACALAAARAAGAAVVAAACQGTVPSLPGALHPVIAVALDWECPRQEVVVDAAGHEVIRLRASGYPRPIPDFPVEWNRSGISFAVANATGIIARELGA